jgi:catechol 2,3-dioxygenase-like lactoylglutathione lyase family enzyme
MSTPVPPEVQCDEENAVLVVSDVRSAVDFYTTKLGFRPSFTWGDPPSYAGVSLGKVRIFLQQGTPSPKGCSICFVVGDADELFAYQQANGVEILAPPGDRQYGLRDYSVRDLHGYELTFGHPVFNVGPSIEIERVDIPVRVEKRLAALLRDLAEHKRMSVNSCLEETLLHTLDGVGPHSASDLRYIEQLKQKHGIDYDSHASYRFVER